MRVRFRVLLLAVTLLLLLFGVGCAKASTLKEDQPVVAGLGKYATASVETKFASPDIEKDAAGFDGRLTERVLEGLKTKQVFPQIEKASAGQADLAIKMTITAASKGSSLNQLAGTGNDATVDVTIEVFDAKSENKSVGKFQVHADSSRSSTMSVNGVDTQTGSNPLNRAVDSAAGEITDHLAKKK
jgi:hypothetical protein